jgi:hypothetical protein
MADNVAITPGSGAKAASREVSYSGETAQMQVVALATVAGADDAKTVSDVSEATPLPVAGYGELIETLQAIRMAIHSLVRSIGMVAVDSGGRLRTSTENTAGTSVNINGSIVASVSNATVTTVSTVTNQSQVGGFAAQDQIPALMHLQADGLRANISVT